MNGLVKEVPMAAAGNLSSELSQLVLGYNSSHKTNIDNITLLK